MHPGRQKWVAEWWISALPRIAAPTPMATPSQRCCCGEPAHAEGVAKINVTLAVAATMNPFLIFIFGLLLFGLVQIDTGGRKKFNAWIQSVFVMNPLFAATAHGR